MRLWSRGEKLIRMEQTCPNKNIRGNTILMALVAIVIVATAALLVTNRTTLFTGAPQASEEPHINPEPASAYKIDVQTVNPGKIVSVGSVEIGSEASIVVLKDTPKDPTVIGKSSSLSIGKHENVVINLTSSIKDGDVVYVRLMGKDGKYIQNDQKLTVEVQKNVGMMMSHYANEY